MEDKVTLDRKTFRALASDTRIEILKSLSGRRMTLSELSKKLGMSFSAIKEHLDDLRSAGLIEQKDEGHKWKYYELTGKGKNIINPYEKKVFIVLAASALAAFYGLSSIASKSVPEASRLMTSFSESASASATQSTPYAEIAVIVISLILFGFCIGYLFMKEKKQLR